MIEELHVASNLVKYALENYINVCRSILSRHELGNVLGRVSKSVLEEIHAVNSYKCNLDDGRALLQQLRNRCADLTPINSLPPELLTRVFIHVAREEECSLQPKWLWLDEGNSKPQVKSPVSLLHICSYWRTVALNFHTLWTHVDLAPFTDAEDRSLQRALFFTSHSGGLALTFHVKIGGNTNSNIQQTILALCADVARRAKSIRICFEGKFGSAHSLIAGKIFASCMPGGPERLSMKLDDYLTPVIVTGKGMKRPPGQSQLLEVSHQHLEAILRRITILSLDSIYPHWASQTYSGLTKLQIVDYGGRAVTITALASVLRACPQLQSFSFRKELQEDEASGNPPPVHLKQLEALHMNFSEVADQESLLRLIWPGSKPLRMTSIVSCGCAPISDEHKWFFERSNVVELYADGPPDSCNLFLPRLLELVPSLKTLYLEGFDLIDKPEYAPPSNRIVPGSHLANVYLAGLNFELDALASLAKKLPLRRITLDPASCAVMGKDRELHRLALYKDALMEMCPIVEFFPCQALYPQDQYELD